MATAAASVGKSPVSVHRVCQHCAVGKIPWRPTSQSKGIIVMSKVIVCAVGRWRGMKKERMQISTDESAHSSDPVTSRDNAWLVTGVVNNVCRGVHRKSVGKLMSDDEWYRPIRNGKVRGRESGTRGGHGMFASETIITANWASASADVTRSHTACIVPH